MRSETEEKWTVFQVVSGKAAGIKSVCTDVEWLALEASQPGANVLVEQGIANEGDAEKLARGKSGDPPPKRPRQTPTQ